MAIEAWIERLQEQTWFQSLKSKWEELDAQSRRYISWALGGLFSVAILGTCLSLWLSVRSVRSEIETKAQLLHFIQHASDELRDLRAKTRGNFMDSEAPPPNWREYLEGIAVASSIDRASMEFGPDVPARKTDLTHETPMAIKVKNLTIRQLVRYLFSLENGNRPVRLNHVSIRTVGNEGYLEADFKLTAYALASKK